MMGAYLLSCFRNGCVCVHITKDQRSPPAGRHAARNTSRQPFTSDSLSLWGLRTTPSSHKPFCMYQNRPRGGRSEGQRGKQRPFKVHGRHVWGCTGGHVTRCRARRRETGRDDACRSGVKGGVPWVSSVHWWGRKGTGSGGGELTQQQQQQGPEHDFEAWTALVHPPRLQSRFWDNPGGRPP